jgi:hypothetical protein
LVWGVKPAISGRQGEAYERNQGGEERVRGRECEKWMGVFSGKGFVGFWPLVFAFFLFYYFIFILSFANSTVVK